MSGLANDLGVTGRLGTAACAAIEDARRGAELLFNDAEARVAVSCIEAIAFSLLDAAEELRANRRQLQLAIERAAGLELAAEEFSGGGYKS